MKAAEVQNLPLEAKKKHKGVDLLKEVAQRPSSIFFWSVYYFLVIFVIWLLSERNSKATANPPKSDDKNGQKMFIWSVGHSKKKYYL